jgi:hypothetical protein
MPTYLTDLLNRVVALQKEAMTAIGVTADAKPRFYYTSESFPYFTNRIADIPISDDGSEDLDLNQPVVIMRFVIAHLTSGYKGEPEARLYEWLPHVKTYLQQRTNWLQSAAYPARMDNLQSARVVNGGGLRVFENAGVNALQVGAELQLQCIFDESIEQNSY